jgi:hypothetical protein
MQAYCVCSDASRAAEFAGGQWRSGGHEEDVAHEDDEKCSQWSPDPDDGQSPCTQADDGYLYGSLSVVATGAAGWVQDQNDKQTPSASEGQQDDVPEEDQRNEQRKLRRMAKREAGRLYVQQSKRTTTVGLRELRTVAGREERSCSGRRGGGEVWQSEAHGASSKCVRPAWLQSGTCGGKRGSQKSVSSEDERR